MGENSNITLEPGTLYIKPTEGDEWQPLAHVSEAQLELTTEADVPRIRAAYTAETVIPVKTQEAIDAFAKALESVNKVWARITQAWEPFGISLAKVAEWAVAYDWARVERPAWAGAYERAKRGRIKKKYQDLILRAYREANR